MSIYYCLQCLENAQRLHLGGLGVSEDGKLSRFFPGRKQNKNGQYTDEQYTPEEAKEAIVQFLARNIGKAFALIQDDDIEMASGAVDYFDEKGDGSLDPSEHEIAIDTLLNENGTFDPYDNMGIRGKLSPMVIDCIDKTVSRFDWMPVMDTIFGREGKEEYERTVPMFYWGKKEDKPGT